MSSIEESLNCIWQKNERFGSWFTKDLVQKWGDFDGKFGVITENWVIWWSKKRLGLDKILLLLYNKNNLMCGRSFMNNELKEEFEALKEKLEKIAKLVGEKRKTIDQTNPAEVKNFNELAEATKKATENEITKFGKKHNAPAKTIKALTLALATSLTLSGCVGFLPGYDDSYDPTQTTAPSLPGVISADNGIYKSKDGKIIIVQYGKAYAMRKNETGETIKEQVEMPKEFESVVSTPNEIVVSYAENANGSTIISKNNVTDVANITFTDAKTGITVTGKQKELVVEDDGRVTLNGAKIDKNGNAEVSYRSGKPTLEYAEIETKPDLFTYTDYKGVTQTVDFSDIMKDTFNASGFGFLTSKESPCKNFSAVYEYVTHRRIGLESKGINSPVDTAMYSVLCNLTFFLSSNITISDLNGKKLAAMLSFSDVSKFIYINDELVPYMGFDPWQGGKFISFASGQNVYSMEMYASESAEKKHNEIHTTIQQEMWNLVYGLAPVDNSFNLDGEKVTYLANNGAIVKYVVPESRFNKGSYQYGKGSRNFQVITPDGETFAISFESVDENTHELLYQTTQQKKEQINGSMANKQME